MLVQEDGAHNNNWQIFAASLADIRFDGFLSSIWFINFTINGGVSQGSGGNPDDDADLYKYWIWN